MVSRSLKAESGRLILSSQIARSRRWALESWMAAGGRSMTIAGQCVRNVWAARNFPISRHTCLNESASTCRKDLMPNSLQKELASLMALLTVPSLSSWGPEHLHDGVLCRACAKPQLLLRETAELMEVTLRAIGPGAPLQLRCPGWDLHGGPLLSPLAPPDSD